MRYYANSDEENFFENKRFSESRLPTYDDIFFLFNTSKTTDNYTKMKFSELRGKVISTSLWKKIKPIIYFDNSKNQKLKNIRSEVFKNNQDYIKLLNAKKVFPFEEFDYSNGKTLKEALKDVNIETYSSMYEYFATGANIGTCWISSELLGVMFEDVKSCRGIMQSLKNTPSSKNGGHAWIEVNHNNEQYVVDTSLLLMIPIKYANSLGYISQKKYPIQSLINEKSDIGDMLYTHYNVLTEQSTENKASFEQYCSQREKDIKKIKIVDDRINDR